MALLSINIQASQLISLRWCNRNIDIGDRSCRCTVDARKVWGNVGCKSTAVKTFLDQHSADHLLPWLISARNAQPETLKIEVRGTEGSRGLFAAVEVAKNEVLLSLPLHKAFGDDEVGLMGPMRSSTFRSSSSCMVTFMPVHVLLRLLRTLACRGARGWL
jgi:hypothetical protein